MNTYRILSVDDCVDTHELLKEALEPAFEVFGIDDGRLFEEAVEIAQPDIIVMDLLMPRISGFELLESIKKGPSRAKGIPVIVLSAKRSIENQKKAYELGAQLYMNKPFEPDRMQRNLKMFVQQAKMQPRQKMFKVNELDKKMQLRSSFHDSKIKSEFDLRREHTQEKQSKPAPDAPRHPEQPSTAARHISLNRPVQVRGDDDDGEVARDPKWMD